MSVLALLTLAVLPGAGDLSAPAPVRYRIEQRIESRVDLSAFGQGEQVQTQSFTWFTTVSFTDTTGGRILHAVLDSVHANLGVVQVPQASYDSARGAVYHGRLDAWGRVVELSGPEGGLLPGLFEAQLKGLFPRRNPAAGPGDQWTDTLTTDTDTPQGRVQVQTVTEFRFEGTEIRDGETVARLGASFTATTSGVIQTPGGEADVSGEGTGTASYLLAPDGHLQQSESRGSGDAVLTSDFAPAPIPIRTSTTVTVARLP